jgi:HAE1 family hydrophobic/amphiphilic exporter-1
MGLTRVAIQRAVTIIMLFGALIVMGWTAYGKLKVDRFPAVTFPAIRIGVSLPGAAPEDVALLVTKPIEDSVVGLSGIDGINSTSSEGQSNITVRFVEGSDVNQAAIDIERKMNALRGQLPSGASAPTIEKFDPSDFPIMSINVSGPQSLEQLYQISNDVIQPRLQSVLGVADASISGGIISEVQVQLDPAKLASYGVSVAQVNQAIAQENVTLPGGNFITGPQESNVRTLGLFQSLDSLRNLMIVNAASGNVRLQDLGTVVQTHKPITRYQRYNGRDAVGISITKQTDANSLDTRDAVLAAIATMNRQRVLPPGATISVVNDTTIFTREALYDVKRDLIIAIILCSMVLLVFLHSMRNTGIVLLAIPTSLISTFLVMYFLNFTLDTISLMALALLIGILVDDSIVVLENINRHLHMGEAPRDAALNGRSEIGLAAIAITLTDVVVYAPIAFMAGNIGKIFKEFGLTIVAATLFSLFVSFTLTPMLASRLLRTHKSTESADEEFSGRGPWWWFTRKWEHGYERLTRGYRKVLIGALAARPLVVLLGVLSVVVAILLIRLNIVGTEYAPQEDNNQFSVNITMPVGSSVTVTDAAMQKMENALRAMPEVKNVFSTVGGGGDSAQQARGRISVDLVDKGQRTRTVWQITSQVRAVGKTIPNAIVTTQVPSVLFGGFGSSITMRITGPDIDTLGQVAAQAQQIVEQTPGTTEVQNSGQLGEPELRAVLDRQRMADNGITATQVGNAVRTLVAGTVVSQYQPEGGAEVDITVVGKDVSQFDQAKLEAVPLINSKGQPIRLGQVAHVTTVRGPSQVTRQDRNPVITINANVNGRSVGDVNREITTKLRPLQAQLPPGYSIGLFGQAQQQSTAFAAILSALVLSVILIYMLMAALYESFIYPLAVMFSLPAALFGAFGGLWLTGNTFNIFSMIGLIMLMGLVAKNAILLVDYTNTLRARGLARREAILQAGPVRLRPILMTTATIVFAMIPLALKFGAGSESRAPMAVVVLGGLLTSTLLTLVLVPVMYTYLDDFQNLLLGRERLAFFEWLRARARYRKQQRAWEPGGGAAPAGAQPGTSLLRRTPVGEGD